MRLGRLRIPKVAMPAATARKMPVVPAPMRVIMKPPAIAIVARTSAPVTGHCIRLAPSPAQYKAYRAPKKPKTEPTVRR
jgi:hypothetical protein